MADRKVGDKVGFEICWCSGEDPDYPVSELQQHALHAKGWQSPRFCEYPQEIGLRFLRPGTEIAQLQLLSHQSKITQRVELYIGEGM